MRRFGGPGHEPCRYFWTEDRVLAMKTPFLVAYDYGQGAVWAVVLADSASQIEEEFPELTLVTERPAWLTNREFDKIKELHSYDIDDRTVGLLAEIIDGRS